MPLPHSLRRIPALLLLALLTLRASAANRPPNVVILLADDQGWGDLGVTGNTDAVTPNIDRLAGQGTSFDRFFVCAVCAPTRAEMLTGRYHPRTGAIGVSTGMERINLDEHTVADVFKAAGYATGAFGKWHSGSQWPYHPNARGFGEYLGFTSGHWAEYFNPPLDHNGQRVRRQGYIADVFTDAALEFITRNRERPFLCYVPFNTPHSPWAVPPEYWQRWKEKPIRLRGPDGDKQDLATTRVVYAMNENLDHNVGRILQRLDQLNLSENTVVIYFSDNGPNTWRWNGGMKGRKGSTDEGGIRVPMFIRWPGHIEPGRTVPQIAGAIDLLPTLAALCGIRFTPPHPLDGRDLTPLLFQAGAPWPGRMIFSHQNGRISVRTETHRLDANGGLFDLTKDPGQQLDIADREPALAAKLRDAVGAWRRELLGGAARPKDNRPFTVGYREFPVTCLPARDGVPHGGVARSASAPNSSFFRHWTSKDDRITWDIDVNTAGDYGVIVYYTCPEADVGSTIELGFRDQRATAKVVRGWDPAPYPGQDTIPRAPAESPAKEFRAMEFGPLRLEQGRGELTLRALDIPGRTVMEVREVGLVLR